MNMTTSASCSIDPDSRRSDRNGPVALLGNNDFGAALQVGVVLLVELFAEDEHDHIGVLLNRPRFAQIGELRPVIPAPAFGSAAKLRQSQDRDPKLFSNGLQSARD